VRTDAYRDQTRGSYPIPLAPLFTLRAYTLKPINGVRRDAACLFMRACVTDVRFNPECVAKQPLSLRPNRRSLSCKR
jgi:hypothetical protein